MVFWDRARFVSLLAFALVVAPSLVPGDRALAEDAKAPVASNTSPAATAGSAAVIAPAPTPEPGLPALLQKAMRARISISTNRVTGQSIPAFHCRHAKEGCEQRLAKFAEYLAQAGTNAGVDPWILTAMAFRESGFNPFAMGSLGELGILQLHPKNPRSKHVRFIHDQWYRKRCQREVGACQQEVVERAAQLLARSVEQCGGDLKDALGSYNTGRCGGNSRYAKRILGERKALLEAVGLSAG
jgi:Transglycosylase SLT domain